MFSHLESKLLIGVTVKILIVEDDPSLARAIQINLEAEDYKTSWATNLKDALRMNKAEKYDLVILDLGLGSENGMDFLVDERERGSRLPILILTAKTDEDTVVEGLQRGANDYMKKPFGNRELIARIKAILREPQIREEQIRYGEIVLIVDQRVVRLGEKQIALNRKEFEILHYLVQRAETIVSREQLLEKINRDGEIFDRTVDSHISHIRSKLKSSGAQTLKIASVYGLGYRLEKT